MRQIARLALAAAAAGALMALVGPSSVAANTLCTENVTPCPAGKTISELDVTQVGTGKLENTQGTITYTTCQESTVRADIEHSGGEEASGKVTEWTFGGCSPATPHPLVLGTIDISASGNVKLTNTETTTTLFAGETCVYGTPAGGLIIGTLDEGANAKVTVNAIPEFRLGGGLCPRSTRWTATFQITNHSAVFNRAGSPSPKHSLCTENISPCPEGSLIKEINMTQVGTGKLENTAGSFIYTTCSEATIRADQEQSGEAEISGKLTESTFGSCSPTTPKVITLGSLDISATNQVKLTGTEMTAELFEGETCVYGTPAGGLVIGTFDEGANAKVTVNALPEFKSGGGLCPRSTRWTATFQITNHSAVFNARPSTKVCTENVTPCPEGKVISELHLTQVGTGHQKNTASTVTYDTCSESTIRVDLEHDVAEEDSGKLTEWTNGNCSPATPHIVTLGSLDINPAGSVKLTNTETTTTLFAGETCVYGTPAGGLVIGTLDGGANAKMTVNALPEFKSGGGLCPRSTRWTATFQITNHSAVFVTDS